MNVIIFRHSMFKTPIDREHRQEMIGTEISLEIIDAINNEKKSLAVEYEND